MLENFSVVSFQVAKWHLLLQNFSGASFAKVSLSEIGGEWSAASMQKCLKIPEKYR